MVVFSYFHIIIDITTLSTAKFFYAMTFSKNNTKDNRNEGILSSTTRAYSVQ